MRNWFLIGVLMAFSGGCSANSELVNFEGLKIPREYVLQFSSEGLAGVFDESDSIALVVSEDEIKDKLPEYQIENRGEREVSFVIGGNLIDLEGVSDSILSGYTISDMHVEVDKYLQYERLYRTSLSWLLVSTDREGKRLEAQCRKSGISGDIEVCYFKRNINGYGVSFTLANTNIAMVKEFEVFLSEKIASWSK